MDGRGSVELRISTTPGTTERKGGRRWAAIVTLCLAVLVAQTDTSVVNLAIRPIGASLHVGIGALQWVLDSYNLVYAALLLTGGLLADLLGRRLIFMAGAAIFSIASLLCAAAPSVLVLIGGRALAGIGAALLLPASLAIIRVVWRDAEERAWALGIWAGCNGLALAIGPTLGGILIDAFGWRSIFLVVVPLAVAALALAPKALPESADPRERRFDLAGQVCGAVALGGLALGAIELHGSLPRAAVGFAVASAGFAAFIAIERRQGAGALVPLDIFRAREFGGAFVATTGMTFGMYGVLFLVPLVWQASGRLGALGAGLALIPMALVFVIVSPFSGSLSGRYGTRPMIGGGVALIGSGLLVIGSTASAASLWVAEFGLVLTGLGMGLATGPLMGVAVGAVPSARSGTASALINVARMVGATIGVALFGSAFAAAQGGAAGLRLAMILGGTVQFLAAALAWRMMRPYGRRARARPE